MFLLSETVDLMLSKDYKERLKAEFWQTSIRHSNLLIKIIFYRKDDKCPKELLEEQLHFMEQYLVILRKRAELENIDLGFIEND